MGTGGGPAVTPPPTNSFLARPAVSAPTAPPPLSGGTLLVLADGRTAFASDPDRDRLYFADLTEEKLLATVTLQLGDEPGRAVEDAEGGVHVVLRRGGAVVSLAPDRTVRERRAVCRSPRGIAYQRQAAALHVACAGGELVTLLTAGGAPTRTVHLDRDLRDVVVAGDQLFVSRFRSGEVLVVSTASGEIVERRPLPGSAPSRQLIMTPEGASAGRRRSRRGLADAIAAGRQPGGVASGERQRRAGRPAGRLWRRPLQVGGGRRHHPFRYHARIGADRRPAGDGDLAHRLRRVSRRQAPGDRAGRQHQRHGDRDAAGAHVPGVGQHRRHRRQRRQSAPVAAAAVGTGGSGGSNSGAPAPAAARRGLHVPATAAPARSRSHRIPAAGGRRHRRRLRRPRPGGGADARAGRGWRSSATGADPSSSPRSPASTAATPYSTWPRATAWPAPPVTPKGGTTVGSGGSSASVPAAPRTCKAGLRPAPRSTGTATCATSAI